MAGPRRADLGIALAGGAIALVASIPWPGEHDSPGVGLVTAGLLGATLGLARWAPAACWGLAASLFLVAGAFGTLPGDDSLVAYLAVAAPAFAAGRFDGRRSGLAGMLVIVAAATTGAYLADGAEAVFLFIPPAAWGAGRALRDRSLAAAQLATRVRELEAEREAFATLSVRYERARIASELHDIVAHAISVMVVQASAGQRLVGRDEEATAETFQAIAGAARQAGREMALLVRLLGDEPSPGPDLALVEELVSRAAASGLDVRMTLEGAREGLPPAVTTAAYRVVQEGLTNALRYAAGASVVVRLRGGRGALEVEVVNGAAGHEAALTGVGGGTGLRGLRERTEALGGSLEAGPHADGGWRVAAHLPHGVRAAVVAAGGP